MPSDIISRHILESMSDGVMTIGFDGRMVTINRAAEAILGITGAEALGCSFAELFLDNEGNDDFNQTIFDAIYDKNTISNRIVPLHRGDAILTLAVTTSFLATNEGGATKNEAVVVVFNDITDMARLRESEQRLTDELKEQHVALQSSYLAMEETNASLHAALRKVQLIRVAATIFVILLFLSVGFITWKQTGALSRASWGGSAKGQQQAAAARSLTIVPTSLTDSIGLKGTLKPIQIVNITSPFTGKIMEKNFEYGQAVAKGQILLKLDRTETEVKYRDAKTAYIEAQEKVKELENWTKGNEMAKAQQSVTRSKLTLDGLQKTYQETERLFKKDIVPATEYASAKQQFTTATMDHESSLRELQTVKERGEGQNMVIARLKLENARQKLEELEDQLRQAEVAAPCGGTVLSPDMAGGKDNKVKVADRGVTFSQGDILLAIGNTEGLSLTAEVDEYEVLKIKKDQEVRVTIDAFGETLRGRVAHISSQAVKADSGRKGASFEVSVTMDGLPVELRPKLRLGMTANMEVLLLNMPNVIMLPIQALLTEGGGRVVNVRDKTTKALKKVKVEPGITTLDAVEIKNGLAAGDEVVY